MQRISQLHNGQTQQRGFQLAASVSAARRCCKRTDLQLMLSVCLTLSLRSEQLQLSYAMNADGRS